MDQQINNSQYEFLSKLLADTGNDASMYFNDLQRLVDDYPQSGILQALLAYTSEDKNLKRASAYYDPSSLFRLINDPSSFPGVPPDRIIIEKSLRTKHPDQLNGHLIELPGSPAENGHDDDNHLNENFFSDPSEFGNNIDEPGNDTGKPEFYRADDLLKEPSITSKTEHSIPIEENLNGEINFASVQSETDHVEPDGKISEENTSELNLPVVETVENIPGTPPDEAIDNKPQVADGGFESEPDHTGSESDHFEFAHPAIIANGIVPYTIDRKDSVEAVATDKHIDVTESNELPNGYIDDEIFDEILGIEHINISRKSPKLSTDDDHDPDSKENSGQISAENDDSGKVDMVEDSSMQDQQVEVIDENILPDSETKLPVLDEKQADNNEQQDVSKYNDDKMPYTFMWWLEKTRQQHSGIFQPYVKPHHHEVSAVAEQGTDELQQQYYQNIFHITSIEEIEQNVPQASFAAVPKRKEQVIIERFIKEEPQIRPQSSDKLDNENKAKKSAEDKDELVTETLAGIYSDQMLYHKAIAAYKKLMLRFPEKSGYFADKISQVEKKIN